MSSISCVFMKSFLLASHHSWFRVHLVVLTIITDPTEAPAGVFEYPRKLEITRIQLMRVGKFDSYLLCQHLYLDSHNGRSYPLVSLSFRYSVFPLSVPFFQTAVNLCLMLADIVTLSQALIITVDESSLEHSVSLDTSLAPQR